MKACHDAQKRVRKNGLVDGALYLAVLYDTHRTAPPPIYLWAGSGLDSVPGAGLAWTPSSGVGSTIRLRRHPDPEQMVLWDLDDVPWTYWSSVRAFDP